VHLLVIVQSKKKMHCKYIKIKKICGYGFEKYLYIKFNENPSSGSRVVPCGQTDMKLIVAFSYFYELA